MSDTGLILNETPSVPKPVPYFNKANAKLMAAKSAETRRQAIADRQQAQAQASMQSKLGPETASARSVPDRFVSASLARIRKHLEKLHNMMDDNKLEPSEIDKIASAISKFSDVESRLAMRPGPGTIKPVEARSQTRAGWLLSGSDEPPVSTQPTRSEQE